MAMRHSMVAAFVLLGGAGCTLLFKEDLDKKQCKSHADCESTAAELGTPLMCRQHACQAPQCTESTDCPAQTTCVRNECVAQIVDGGQPAVACTQDTDCPARSRCGFDGSCYEKWGCLSEDPRWPGAPSSFRYMATVRRVEVPSDPSAVGPLLVTACSSADPTCSIPTVVSAQVMISEDVMVTVPFAGALPSGFTGTIRILLASGGGASSELMPYYRHFTTETPLVGDLTERAPVMLVGSANFALLAELAGVTADPSAGVIGLQVYDCGGRAAAGMSMVPTGTTSYVFIPTSGVSTPLIGATETTSDGFALLLNLPPNRTLTFVLRDEQEQRIITSTLSFIVYGAAMNDVTYYPRHSALQKGLGQAAQ